MELALGLIVLVGLGYLLYLNNQKTKNTTVDKPTEPAELTVTEAPVVEKVAAPVEVVVAEEPKKAPKKAKTSTKPATKKAPAKKPKIKVAK
jgi:topoisomerase IA-like protein